MWSKRFRKYIPTAETLKGNRFLQPFNRYLHHHFLWQFNRKMVAGGVAAGLFFGILLPFLQILFAALAAILFRVNLPVAAFSTFISNPLTFPGRAEIKEKNVHNTNGNKGRIFHQKLKYKRN